MFSEGVYLNLSRSEGGFKNFLGKYIV
jgi:hypothetical protein